MTAAIIQQTDRVSSLKQYAIWQNNSGNADRMGFGSHSRISSARRVAIRHEDDGAGNGRGVD
jgi:hypothetical protein